MSETNEKPDLRTAAYRIPVPLIKRLKLAAAEQGRTMSAIVIEAIEAAVELHEEQRPQTAA
jgi:predicted DNA-binding protein